MITINDIEYEPEQTKIVYLAAQTVGLFAGDMQLHAAVVPRVMARVKLITGTILVEEIAEFYAEEFAKYRRARAERQYLTPLNLSVDEFLIKQQNMLQDIAFDLTNKMLHAGISSEAIIAGIDQTGAHIFKIHDPGLATCFDTPFFAASGIGENHATSQFMLAKFEKRWSVEKTIFLTYTAKTRAEAAAGVGKQTDMVLIRPGAIIYAFTQDDLKALDSLLTTVSAKEAAVLDETYEAIKEYVKKSQPDDTGPDN